VYAMLLVVAGRAFQHEAWNVIAGLVSLSVNAWAVSITCCAPAPLPWVNQATSPGCRSFQPSATFCAEHDISLGASMSKAPAWMLDAPQLHGGVPQGQQPSAS
jgi:hypothetical protein